MGKIRQVQHRNGTVAYMVDGRYAGERVRRCYPTRAEASAELERLERKHRAVGRTAVPVVTWMSEDQVRRAELATATLADTGADLLTVATAYALSHTGVTQRLLSDAIGEFLQAKQAAGLRPATLDKYRYLLDAWRRSIPAEYVADVTAADCEGYVTAGRSVEARRDRRTTLHTFLAWARRSRMLDGDPMQHIDSIRRPDRLPAILTVDQSRRLLDAASTIADGRMLPWIALCGWSGLRPSEAKRITADDVYLDEDLRCVEVGPAIAKVRQCRRVELCEGLRDLLRGVADPGWHQPAAYRAIRQAAGVLDGWESDIMRHTYASCHYAIHQDVRRLTYTMGNSESVLFRRYIRPIPLRDAVAYFALLSSPVG